VLKLVSSPNGAVGLGTVPPQAVRTVPYILPYLCQNATTHNLRLIVQLFYIGIQVYSDSIGAILNVQTHPLTVKSPSSFLCL